MGRKETVWGARHIAEAEEIKRIINEYNKLFNIQITKLEASAILAERSKSVFWDKNEARKILERLRGL